MARHRSRRSRFTRKLALLASIAVLIIVAGSLFAYSRYHTTSQIIPSTTGTTATSTQNAPNQPAASSSSSSSSSSSNNSSAAKQTPSSGGFGASSSASSGSSAALLAPTGQFVSSHTVPSGVEEESVCNTTAGATCYIKFTMGNTTQALSTQTTDSSGAAYWTWKVNLAAGTWQITAVASLNGQTQSTNDAMVLTVQ